MGAERRCVQVQAVVSVIEGARLGGMGPEGTAIYVHEVQDVRWPRQVECDNP